MSSEKKILTIALEGERKVQAMALYEDSRLMVLEMNDITGDPDVWLETMRRDVAQKTQGGWVVMVEDRTNSFPGEATSFNFDAMCEDGRTNLQCCLDWYFDMQARGQIILEQNMERFKIYLNSQLIDAKHDDKGRIVYNVNWKEFTGGHKALLMCVAGAAMENPLSERWLRVMTGARSKTKGQNENPMRAFITALHTSDASAQRRIELKQEHSEVCRARKWGLHE